MHCGRTILQHWKTSILSLAVLLVISNPALPADAPPPEIRAFDIPMIEKLGREMYEQDQEAWKATDILRARYSDTELKTEKLHGWIVDSSAGSDVVRFIRDGANGPEAFCDVNFAQEYAPTCSAPASPILTADEIAQYNARLLAAKNIERPCSEHYNTIALKDPQGDNWLVWALASTTELGVVVYGGHYRFTIASDGKTVIRRDALSRACLNTPPPNPNAGKQVAMFFVQLVSNIPVETAVWLNLQHKTPIIIVTPDKKLWHVIDGKITQSGDLSQSP